MFEPTWESVRTHQVPEWYDDAKLGIFLHWGLYSVPGLASIAVFVSFLGGIQLLVLGLMGEYIARIHDEVKDRPLYLVQDMQGLSDDPYTTRS